MHSNCRYVKPANCHRCNCCPYGYHIDVDFVHYCEALSAALYGKKCSTPGSASVSSPSPNQLRHRLCVNRLKPVSIEPSRIVPCLKSSLKQTKSIGISTNFAPVLTPRTSSSPSWSSSHSSFLTLKDLQSSLKASPKLAQHLSRGTCTSPVHISPIITTGEKSVQVCPHSLNAATFTEPINQREVGLSVDSRREIELRGLSRHVQTDRITNIDRDVQVSEKCNNCELRQTETIAVGSSISMTDSSVNTEPLINTITPSSNQNKMTDSMISSVASIASVGSNHSVKLCDKCNEIIHSMAKEVVKEKTSSPVLGSRIPRLTNPPSLNSTMNNNTQLSPINNNTNNLNNSNNNRTPLASLPPTTPRTISNHNLIIEEGNNDEILVYRNPNANMSSRKHRSNVPSMMVPLIDLEGIRLLDEACKISDSESDLDSRSSSEATFILDDDGDDSPRSSTISSSYHRRKSRKR